MWGEGGVNMIIVTIDAMVTGVWRLHLDRNRKMENGGENRLIEIPSEKMRVLASAVIQDGSTLHARSLIQRLKCHKFVRRLIPIHNQ